MTWVWFFVQTFVQDAAPSSPTFDETERWIANNGLGAVLVILIIVPGIWIFSRLVNGVVGNLAMRVDTAVAYFTNKLDALSDRQEKSLDRLDDRLSAMTGANIDSATRLASALGSIADSQREQAAALSALNESNRILLTFMTQNMANMQAHRSIVEPLVAGHEGAATGVIKSVAPEEH